MIDGLWGFNPALTALAVSVFFVQSPASVALAGSGAAATAVLSAGMVRRGPQRLRADAAGVAQPHARKPAGRG